MTRERTIGVLGNRLAIEVQLVVGARALGLDVSHLEDDLVGRGVSRYQLYGAVQGLTPQQAQKRIEAVVGFVVRTGTPVDADYFSPVVSLLDRRNGGSNGS